MGNKQAYHRVLTIAGSDSGGGAGIQADLKTFSALGTYGMSVVAALTAQNTVRVTAVHDVPPEFVAEQLDAVLDDIGVDAVKIGMLNNVGVIEAVADRLKSYAVGNIVLDPVMVSKSGAKLLQDDAVEVLREKLLPMALVLTPNVWEAGVLLGVSVKDRDDMELVCKKLSELGIKAVLLKGGHLKGNRSPDCLYISEGVEKGTHWLDSQRIDTQNSHGTGCTLSAAIAANLAKGLSLLEAVGQAKAYLTQALQKGAEVKIGKGQGPVHHFHRWW